MDAPSARSPTVYQRFHAHISQPMLYVEWDIRATTAQEPEAWVQWSSDEGKTWYGLTVGLRGHDSEIDLSALPSGNVLLRLLAHDGFFTATSDPISVEIPLRVPTAAILDPRDGSRMEAGSPLRLWGIGTHGTGKLVEPGYARWLINGNEVARGLNVFVTAPSEGKHSCTLIIEAGRESTEVTITFETVAVPHESTEL
jgi:hypothetical protein